MGQIGKPGPAGNFPRKFEVCPECGKKGVYTRSWSFHIGMKEKLCKYCHYHAAPFFNGERADPAKEFAELRRAIHELNTLITGFCERWEIPVYGRFHDDMPDMQETPGDVPGAGRHSEDEKKRMLSLRI